MGMFVILYEVSLSDSLGSNNVAILVGAANIPADAECLYDLSVGTLNE